MATFDVAIIGAGINGCALAHCLTEAGLSVALFDAGEIASGGSGAAGAFISPKISKSGPLKEVMEAAYTFSLPFYHSISPEHMTLSRQLHIAKFEDENAKVEAFKASTMLPLAEGDPAIEALLHEDVKAFASVFLEQSAVVDAVGMCHHLAQNAQHCPGEVSTLQRSGSLWNLNGKTAKSVVLATGAYAPVMPEPYLSLRGVWGHRIDIKTSTRIDAIIHHRVSLAPTDAAGHSAIGATHDVHYHPQRSTAPYDIEAGRAELLQKALGTVKLHDVEILKDYTGLRSGSNDYLPILGPLVDAEATLQQHPKLRDGAKVEPSEYVYHPDLYMINGSGGYGFVLAPLLALQLAAFLADGTPLDPQLLPSRFFTRWVKHQR